MIRLSRWLLLLHLLLVFTSTIAETLQGHVIAIQDGDTLTLLTTEKYQVRIRLAEIDTPETAQPYGARAKQALSDLVFNRDVSVEIITIDRYDRLVGRIFVDGRDVNAALVTAGAAWVYRQYSEDPQLLALEAEARAAGRGLWGLPEAQRIPPWQWRRGQ